MRRDKIVRGRYEISLKKITGGAHASKSPDIVDDEEEAGRHCKRGSAFELALCQVYLQVLLENELRSKRLHCEHRLTGRTGDLNDIARRVDADNRACPKINGRRNNDVDVWCIHHIDVFRAGALRVASL